MKRVYMEKYYRKVFNLGARRFRLTTLLLVLFSFVEFSVADALDRCDAQSKLPKHLSHIRFKGASAEGCEHPVVIEHAKSTAEGIAAENVWISACYPSAHIKTKAVTRSGKKVLEVIEIEAKDNTTKQLCFDITNFFGSW